jgi:micrococcal nuclease
MVAESFRAQQCWVIIGVLVGIAAQQYFTSPELPQEADWNESTPLSPPAKPIVLAQNPFMHVAVRRVYDGDTIFIDLPHTPEVFGTNLGVRLFGIDAPEMRGSKCAVEKCLARGARDFLQDMIHRASNVELRGAKRGKYFRLVARVFLTDRDNLVFDASRRLISEGWAIPYLGDKKKAHFWCSSGADHSAALTEHVRQCERMEDEY